LVSYPNFLPFEMLTRVGHLLYAGHRPRVVVLGLTWRNIARDSQLRHQVYRTYRDAKFEQALVAMLADPQVHAAPEVIEEVEAQRRRVEHDEERERLQSDSDRIDQWLTEQLGERLTLLGKSAALRGRLFRTMTNRVQRVWEERGQIEYSYDLVDSDYAFNVQCLRALVRLLRAHGATVICYLAPERSDLPPLMDPNRQDEFIAQFTGEAQPLGVAVVDARGVVPNSYWGWVNETADRSHFTEPGHQLLAKFLLAQPEVAKAFAELAAP
jgi:hypothetical protein